MNANNEATDRLSPRKHSLLLVGLLAFPQNANVNLTVIYASVCFLDPCVHIDTQASKVCTSRARSEENISLQLSFTLGGWTGTASPVPCSLNHIFLKSRISLDRDAIACRK